MKPMGCAKCPSQRWEPQDNIAHGNEDEVRPWGQSKTSVREADQYMQLISSELNRKLN